MVVRFHPLLALTFLFLMGTPSRIWSQGNFCGTDEPEFDISKLKILGDAGQETGGTLMIP